MRRLTFQRKSNNKLSFEGKSLLTGRHKIHPYPAMLHPLLVDSLLKKYSNQNQVIYDPFCGTGVTLLQASLMGFNSIGTDINPLALLIAKVKSSNYNHEILKNEFKELCNKLLTKKKTSIPKIKNIDYWYSEQVIEDLGKIRSILQENIFSYNDFFLVNFAFIVRKQSYTRNGEFKRYRIQKEKIKNQQNKVIEEFINHTSISIKNFSNNPLINPIIKKINVSDKSIEQKYDVVITSPPYGDSSTTVAYGQYTSFGSSWINDLNKFDRKEFNISSIDNQSLGKKSNIDKNIYKSNELCRVLDQVSKFDLKRSKEVERFFNEYFKSIKMFRKNLNPNGKFIFVVGNRTVKNTNIPMDQITSEFFCMNDLRFKEIHIRTIHNKVMPSKNSPKNIVGKISNTMRKEYIVIFEN